MYQTQQFVQQLFVLLNIYDHKITRDTMIIWSSWVNIYNHSLWLTIRIIIIVFKFDEHVRMK